MASNLISEKDEEGNHVSEGKSKFIENEILTGHPNLKMKTENFEPASAKRSYEKMLFCVTCEKPIHKDVFKNHSNHKVKGYKEGLDIIKTKEQVQIEILFQKIDASLTDNMQINKAVALTKTKLMDSLQGIFKSERKVSQEKIDGLIKLKKKVNKVENDFKNANVYLVIHNDIKNRIMEAENFLKNLEPKPFWIVTNWFKATLGMMLHCGKKVFLTMESRGIINKAGSVHLLGDRILFSCLRTFSNLELDEAICLPYETVEHLFVKEESCMFLSFSCDGSNLGTVITRINCETLWGKQFILLCTGAKGASYIGSRLFRSCLKNKKFGNHIWGGDYSMGDGSGGESILPDDTPIFYHPKKIHKGLIASRFGYKDRSSIFRIHLSEMDDGNTKNLIPVDKFAFGHVEEGLDVLYHISEHKNITKIIVSDAGRVLELS